MKFSKKGNKEQKMRESKGNPTHNPRKPHRGSHSSPVLEAISYYLSLGQVEEPVELPSTVLAGVEAGEAGNTPLQLVDRKIIIVWSDEM